MICNDYVLILPQYYFLSPGSWDLEGTLCEDHHYEPASADNPPDKLFVPSALHATLQGTSISLFYWNDGEVFAIWVLMDSWCWWSKLRNLVDWEAFDPVEQTWVPMADILDSMVVQFYGNHHDKPALGPGGPGAFFGPPL